MERCDDREVLDWMIARLRELATHDEGMLLPSYLRLLRSSDSVRAHPALKELMADASLQDDVRTLFAFAAQQGMTALQREDFLIASLRSAPIPRAWGGAASLSLLRDRGDAFVRRLGAELRANPAGTWDPIVIETVVANLRHDDLFPVSVEGARELGEALGQVSQDARLPPESRQEAARFLRQLRPN
jgi:hypothetical protein